MATYKISPTSIWHFKTIIIGIFYIMTHINLTVLDPIYFDILDHIIFTCWPTLIWQFWTHYVLTFWSMLIWQFLTNFILTFWAHIILTFWPILNWHIWPILIWRTYNLDEAFCQEKCSSLRSKSCKMRYFVEFANKVENHNPNWTTKQKSIREKMHNFKWKKG